MKFNPQWLIVPAAATFAAVSPAHAATYMSVQQAQKAIFPEATQFIYKPVTLSKAQMQEIQKRSGVAQRWTTQEVWRAEKDGRLLGYFISDKVIGKHEFITYGVGLNANGSVRNVEVLVYNETRGSEVRQDSWLNHFKGKTLKDSFKLNKDIPNISGATLSCKNIMNGVKRLLVLQSLALPKS